MEFTTEVITQVLEQRQNQARQQGIVLEVLPVGEQIPYLYQGLQAPGVALTKRLWEAKDQALHRGGVVSHQAACVQAGRPMRRTARRTAQVATVFGEVRFRRGAYPGRYGHADAPWTRPWACSRVSRTPIWRGCWRRSAPRSPSNGEPGGRRGGSMWR